MRPGGDDGRLRTPEPVRGKRVGGMNHRERRVVGVVTVRVRVSVGDVDAMVKMVMLVMMMMMMMMILITLMHAHTWVGL